MIDALLAAGAAAPAQLVEQALGEQEQVAAETLLARGAPLTAPAAAGLGRVAELAGLLTPADLAAALALAVGNQQTAAVAVVLDAGAPVDALLPPRHQWTALHVAAGHDDVATVALLLDRGARTDIVDLMWHGTPLGWARHQGSARAAELLG